MNVKENTSIINNQMFILKYLIFLTICACAFCNKPSSIVKLLEQNRMYKNEDDVGRRISSNMERVMVYMYYPTRAAPPGYYDIIIKIWDKDNKISSRRIGRIQHTTGDLIGKWIDAYNIFWDFYVNEIYNYEIYTTHSNYPYDSSESNIYSSDSSYAEKVSKSWRFVVYFKDRTENFDGKIEDPNLYDKVTDEFCMETTYTTGNNRTMGAVCPYNTYNANKVMDMCLNWRRTDIIGDMCSGLSKTVRENSTDNFCNKFTTAEDCQCINRHLDPYFKKVENYDNHLKYYGHYYCWYQPCKSNYLKKEEDIKVACPRCDLDLTASLFDRKEDRIIRCKNNPSITDKRECLKYLNTNTVCIFYYHVRIHVVETPFGYRNEFYHIDLFNDY